MSARLRKIVGLLVVVALLLLLLIAAERTVALAQRLGALPEWLQWLVGTMLALFALGAAWVAWLWLRPRRRRPAAVVDRASIDQRIDQLELMGADIAPLHKELQQLDQRREQGTLYVAVFGEISSGKSSLVASLASDSQLTTDVIGGSTRAVSHHDGSLRDGRIVRWTDVPGSRESGGESREALARDEALRAHAVIYVCTGDLTRAQMQELRWLAEFGKPMLLALNKADQWQADERQTLLANLRERGNGLVDAVLAISAGGSERFTRTLADGRLEQVERSRATDVAALLDAVERLTSPGAEALEAARERAVLAGLHERTSTLETSQRAIEAERVVARYTRRAIVGAMAAVAPGSDLVIQGVLATAMARALARVHNVNISDIELDNFLKQARMTLRTSASVVLAIAGNALKAFPGLGTLGGGILHAFAYALIFDSLGKALAATLAEHHSLDQQLAGEKLRTLLGDAGKTRIKRLASLTVDAIREPKSPEKSS